MSFFLFCLFLTLCSVLSLLLSISICLFPFLFFILSRSPCHFYMPFIILLLSPYFLSLAYHFRVLLLPVLFTFPLRIIFVTVPYFPIFSFSLILPSFPSSSSLSSAIFSPQSAAHERFFPPNFPVFVPAIRHLGNSLTFFRVAKFRRV